MQHCMSRDDDRCCFCRSASWEIFKRRFFPSVRKRPTYRKFPQVKVPGKDWSIAGKLRQWVLRVWQERSLESQSWPVWSRGLRCMWLIWSCQLSHQCERATVSSAYRNKTGPGTRGLWKYVMEEVNTERLWKINVQRCFRMSFSFLE